jgi:hypothetical protein
MIKMIYSLAAAITIPFSLFAGDSPQQPSTIESDAPPNAALKATWNETAGAIQLDYDGKRLFDGHLTGAAAFSEKTSSEQETVDAKPKQLLLAPSEPLRESHRHLTHTMSIHPFGLLSVDGSDDDRAVIDATCKLYDRLGTHERFFAALRMTAFFSQITPFG